MEAEITEVPSTHKRNRATGFSHKTRVDGLKETIVVEGQRFDCQLQSLKLVKEDIIEVTFRISDSKSISAWKSSQSTLETLKMKIREIAERLLPSNVEVKYVQFEKGSLLIKIGIGLIVGAVMFVAGAETGNHVLQILTQAYQFYSTNERVSEFVDSFDQRAKNWFSQIMDWLFETFNNILDWLHDTIDSVIQEFVGQRKYWRMWWPLGPFGIIIMLLRSVVFRNKYGL